VIITNYEAYYLVLCSSEVIIFFQKVTLEGHDQYEAVLLCF